MKTMSSGEAQNNFGVLLDTAQREPVTITRRGRPVAFLLSPQEYESLIRGVETAESRNLRDAAHAALAAFRGSGRGGGVQRLLADRETERLREA
jgi:prevent-host-death family protein